ncbi:MAG TPA: hypothetical protein VK470_03370 [Bacteroidota bacterium]|nr:hypothetical protein [Bacteroidota bacterium]
MNYKYLNIRMLPVLLGVLLLAGSMRTVTAQELRYLHVGQLQSGFMDWGTEYEIGVEASNMMQWPTQYGDRQFTSRSRLMWMGSKQFDDPVEGKTKPYKVVGFGPRYDVINQGGMIFPKSIKLIAKAEPPVVIVDKKNGTSNTLYDKPDEIRPDLPCDRMIEITFNTSMGVSVTKRILAFTQQNHDSYFILDYVIKNTGIYNNAGAVKAQTLNDFWVYFGYRSSFGGITSGWNSTWGDFSSEWGASSLYHDFGNPYRPMQDGLRGYYSYYSPISGGGRTGLTSYDQDWGCPKQDGGGKNLNGVLGSAKFSGTATLFASKSANEWTDDPTQPHTTAYNNVDDDFLNPPYSQYDEVFMRKRYGWMTEGHLPQSEREAVGNQYYSAFYSAMKNTGGRYGGFQGQGYGPYTLAPGDSIRIVVADGAAGISWEKCREVGANWYEYYKGTSSPKLVMPNGSTTTSYTEYTKAWVFTGQDSILKTLRNAVANFKSGYKVPSAPPAPKKFTVESGGDRISLSWEGNAFSDPHFGGYVIYRSEGSIKDYRSEYVKIFECGKQNITSYNDTSAIRGFKYFYFIQSKDDGTQNDVTPGMPLYSSMFLTMTSVPAFLLRPAGNFLEEVRVVPNPFDIRSRKLQFGDVSSLDQIVFYGLPPVCRLKIFSENGTLVWQKEHTNGSGDEKWDSKTTYGQVVVSGIYILHVEVTEDVVAKSDVYAKYDVVDDKMQVKFKTGEKMVSVGDKVYRSGESIFRKFVVIR